MSKEAFLFCLVLGAGLLALWLAMRFPEQGPSRMSTSFAHVAVAMLVSMLIAPAMTFVAGAGIFLAVFAVALPAFTYMFLAAIWLTRAFLAAVPH
jgi:hypothetical protein